MTKYILILFIFIAPSALFSQEPNLFELGLKASMHSSISNNTHYEDQVFGGYSAGLTTVIQLPLTGLGFQGEVLFRQQNLKLKPDSYDAMNLVALAQNKVVGFTKDENISQFSIAVPVLIQYTFFKILAFQVGPQFNFLINPDDYNVGSEPISNPIQVQAVAGVKVSVSSFSFYLRYSQDVISMTDNQPQKLFGNATNSNIAIGVGYALLKL